ncbi:Chondroitin sulfate synthase 2 [Eufriesea mexicana]|nr:Chondroitin sulfate synthase 2 [Eufriesea mexicana]
MHYLSYQEDLDEYEPKININNKPQQAQKVSKALVRPRYYSTELGIREKLFIGVITSQQYLYSRDIAINKTVAHIVDKVRYFISIPEGTKPNVTLPGIVGFTDTRSILKPFHTMKYIIDNYLENYDYYFLIKDANYINIKKLVKFVTKISVSQNVHVGVLGDIPTYCSLDSGILLSNSVIQELKNNLDWCVKNSYSESDDINFGRCIMHSTSIPCSNHIQGQKFLYTKLEPTFSFEQNLKQLVRNKQFLNSLVIYPIYDHFLVYKLNTYFAAELKTDAKFDIERIINITASSILADYQDTIKFNKLLNGYRRFDASRGMDYILDLAFIDVSTSKILRKRIEVCKPLGKVEILPVPYVTENTRINIILIINLSKKQDALNFLEQYALDCMEKKYKTFLMVVLLYNFDAASKGKGDIYYEIKQYALLLAEKYKKQQSKITWLSIRLPNIITSVETNHLLNIAITDLCIRKFTPESLILFVETGIELRLDYLNRIRMNTINQYQVFSPIPFMEYHPDIVHMNDIKQVDTDINRNHGRYDEYNFNNIAFYVKDYNTMRKTVETSIPIIHSDRDISSMLKLSQNIPITSLFEMFVSFSNVHILRAIEPALKVKYKNFDCSYTTDDINKFCIWSKNLHLGRRSQLARLILDYQTYLNTL